MKMKTDQETALRMIKKAEAQKQTYIQIRKIAGTKKEKNPLTQVDIQSGTPPQIATLTTKAEIELAILERNQRHARQSLQTPFASNPVLAQAINPDHPDNKIEQIVQGSFLASHDDIHLNDLERQWVQELQSRMDQEINTHITIDDFKRYFKSRKEKTASSFSGRHMGHYKAISEMANYNETVAEILTTIINISIITSRPLHRWQCSVQVMIEKGKGRNVENLRIIHLCEADLNFVLNIIWGYRLIRTAQKANQLDSSQFALPGQTCHSAVWNKLLYCDLMRQTLSAGIMTDYDATAAFDTVLHAMSIITCRRLGLPFHACLFMYYLLQHMEFFLLTGFGISSTSFRNDEDPTQTGQGVLQGSSSAAPIYNICTDVSLTTYNRLAQGASFTHPITGQTIQDHTTQYVDDKTEMLNINGLHNHMPRNPNSTYKRERLFEAATTNTKIWSSLLWLSGGNLNSSKCFYYYIQPRYNFKRMNTEYIKEKKAPGQLTLFNHATSIATSMERLEPSIARRTLGVILAPNGDCKQQIRTSINKANVFLGKIKHSKLSNQAKWTEITSIMEPEVQYPLISTYCDRKDIDKIDRVITRAKCNALGLNPHFPRAVLHGPLHLGGMAIPTSLSKTILSRINYFLYHTRTSTRVGMKLDASIIFLQLEVGLFDSFFSSSYATYGHLATKH
jgi:hypothetical protein